jgi:hypothetical protein
VYGGAREGSKLKLHGIIIIIIVHAAGRSDACDQLKESEIQNACACIYSYI